MKRINPDLIAFTILLLIDIILTYPIIWPGNFVLSTSYYFPLEPARYVNNFLSSSWDHSLFGRPIASDLVNLPYLMSIAVLSTLLGPQVTSGIVPFLAWYLVSVASYFFLKNFIRVGAVASFLGTLLMSYNPVIVYIIFRSFNISEMLSYAGIPLLIFTTARYLELKRIIYAILAGIIWITLLWFPPSMFIAFLSIALYIVVLIFWEWKIERKTIRTSVSIKLPRLLLLLLIILASSSIWLIPTAIVLRTHAISAEMSFFVNRESLIQFTEYNSLFLKPPGPLLGLIDNRFSIDFSNAYLIIGTIVTVLSLFSVILFRREFSIFYFSILYVVATFLTKGTNEPLGSFYISVLRSIPFVTILRNPLHFNILTIQSISVLLAFLLDKLVSLSLRSYRRGKHWRALGFTFVILLLASLLLSLVLNPQVVVTLHNIGSNRLPSYYLDCAYFLENELQNDTFRVIFPGTLYAAYYTWSTTPIEKPPIAYSFPAFVGIDITSTGGLNEDLQFLSSYLFSATSIGRSEIMGILNIKYAIVLNDMIHKNSEHDIQTVKNMSNLALEKKFGAISLYRNLRYRPIIYVPKTIVLVKNVYELIESAKDVEKFNISDASYMDEETFEALHLRDATHAKVYGTRIMYEIDQHKISINNIYIKRITYGKYEVHVYNVSNSLFLVLSESYNPLWSLKIQNRNEENISVKHFKVNLYANGWLINGTSGDLTITIEYTGKKYFNLSLLIFSVYSTISIGCLLSYLIKNNLNFTKRIQNDSKG